MFRVEDKVYSLPYDILRYPILQYFCVWINVVNGFYFIIDFFFIRIKSSTSRKLPNEIDVCMQSGFCRIYLTKWGFFVYIKLCINLNIEKGNWCKSSTDPPL